LTKTIKSILHDIFNHQQHNGVVYRKESQEKTVYPSDVNPIF